MRILYHHRIASKDGQYVHISAIVTALRKLGIELQIVCPALSEAQRFGGEVTMVAALRQRLPKVLYEFLELGYSAVDFVKLVAAIIRFKPDIIYERYNLFFPSGVIAGKLFNVPLILEVNAPLYDERSKYGGLRLAKLARWTERYVWRNADFVLPVTRVLADRVAQEGVRPQVIEVIANGVDEAQFCAEIGAKHVFSSPPGRVMVGFVGFCREWHELDKIIELIAEDKSQKLDFLIVGDGPVIHGLRAQAARLGCEDRVHFTGLVAREDIPRWLAVIDIAIQPAVVPYASPLKLIEYLAAGKAIVAPAQANIRELLTHEKNALLFPEGSPDQLVAAVRRLASDEKLRERLALAAKRTIQEKSLLWDENARRIVALGDRLCASKPSE